MKFSQAMAAMKRLFRRGSSKQAQLLEDARSLPLTPALSLREREKRSPSLNVSERTELTKKPAVGPPLPEGEGRGEGDGDVEIPEPSGVWKWLQKLSRFSRSEIQFRKYHVA